MAKGKGATKKIGARVGREAQDGDLGRRFRYEMAFDPRFAGRRWADVEPELRSEYPAWAQAHGVHEANDEAWKRVKAGVREAWESTLDVEHTLTDARTGRWEERAPAYKRLWEARYGASGPRWEDVEPGYRFVHEMALDPRYQGRPWGDVAPLLEAGLPAWAVAHGYRITEEPGLWERLREIVQDMWKRTSHANGQADKRG
jgi:hypothetical protein